MKRNFYIENYRMNAQWSRKYRFNPPTDIRTFYINSSHHFMSKFGVFYAEKNNKKGIPVESIRTKNTSNEINLKKLNRWTWVNINIDQKCYRVWCSIVTLYSNILIMLSHWKWLSAKYYILTINDPMNINWQFEQKPENNPDIFPKQTNEVRFKQSQYSYEHLISRYFDEIQVSICHYNYIHFDSV